MAQSMDAIGAIRKCCSLGLGWSQLRTSRCLGRYQPRHVSWDHRRRALMTLQMQICLMTLQMHAMRSRCLRFQCSRLTQRKWVTATHRSWSQRRSNRKLRRQELAMLRLRPPTLVRTRNCCQRDDHHLCDVSDHLCATACMRSMLKSSGSGSSRGTRLRARRTRSFRSCRIGWPDGDTRLLPHFASETKSSGKVAEGLRTTPSHSRQMWRATLIQIGKLRPATRR
mmetsp:Transcript_130839/g.238000  ORF Transcript_130839/g.238000 Transcript_130839/m.238000 type:complete len:225 (-) Transcript_130839:109-783(-)